MTASTEILRRVTRIAPLAFISILCACETTPAYPQSTAPVMGLGVAGAPSPPPDAPSLPDGERCNSDAECESEHCSNQICCAMGDCCQTEQDCPMQPTAVCDEKTTCQGTRGSQTCSRFRCRARDGVEDDSACDASIVADDCGPYLPVSCTGKADQEPPECADSCKDDNACDSDAHCEDGECVPDEKDGEACDNDSQCISGHCNNQLCCKEGDCCTEASQCSAAQYGNAGTCNDPKTCQGTRGVPACERFQCATVEQDDDSACNRNVIADDCGEAPDVKCRGSVEQEAPAPCASGTCGGFGGSSCNAEAFCWQGECVPDQPNGEGCPDDGACQSGHCGNNVCCEAGECCENDSQCGATTKCTDTEHCQGQRTERYCDLTIGACAEREPVDDDTACGGMASTRDCGLNVAPMCGRGEDLEDAPECGRCTNLPRCAATTLVEQTRGSGEDAMTVWVTVCTQWVNDIPVGCKGSARCNAATGKCY